MKNRIVKMSSEDVENFRNKMDRFMKKDFTEEELKLREVRLARMKEVTEMIEKILSVIQF